MSASGSLAAIAASDGFGREMSPQPDAPMSADRGDGRGLYRAAIACLENRRCCWIELTLKAQSGASMSRLPCTVRPVPARAEGVDAPVAGALIRAYGASLDGDGGIAEEREEDRRFGLGDGDLDVIGLMVDSCWRAN